MTRTPPAPVGSTVLGYPRIGRDRQLKKALESYWAGRIDGGTLDRDSLSVRLDALYTMSRAGLDTIPVNTFSWYDQMLDTTVLVGAVPKRFAGVSGDHTLAGFDASRYFAMARGTKGVPPLEMTKWFDTNYHYLVPEIGPDTAFALHADKPLAEFDEAHSRKIASRPVVVGPFTFLALAKAADGAPEGFDPLSRLGELTEVYVELLAALAAAGVQWVQIDEPALVRDVSRDEIEAAYATYDRLAQVADRPAILLATYFGSPGADVLSALAHTEVEGFALDLLRGPKPGEIEDLEDLFDKSLVLGAVDGRNIWRTDLRAAAEELTTWRGISRTVSVSTSCSLLHVPYDVAVEVDLDPALRSSLAFADQKLAEVVALQQSLDSEGAEFAEAFAASDAAVAGRSSIPGLYRGEVAGRVSR
ncbi:MAG: 5-methyltetrahydropteroyltriglutamate--homocysteine S-methyltransferase, partial [Nocardioides sp.]|nr:5-methyltetrahydropteroyltriglutamate--homocysteine S-methyltransferase [Nocardioides sp.]